MSMRPLWNSDSVPFGTATPFPAAPPPLGLPRVEIDVQPGTERGPRLQV